MNKLQLFLAMRPFFCSPGGKFDRSLSVQDRSAPVKCDRSRGYANEPGSRGQAMEEKDCAGKLCPDARKAESGR
jgi:hypothetical protein